MRQDNETAIWMDGEFLGRDEAKVAVSDSLFQHGFGLFETIRAYGGNVFRLDDHLRRLAASVEALGIAIGVDGDTLGRAVTEVIEANALADARVRITVSRGDLAQIVEGEALPATVVVTAGPLTVYPTEMYEHGLTVAVADTRHNETDPMLGHKVGGNYASRLRVLQAAQLKGCGEGLMFTLNRRLAGGSISNVFIIRGGSVFTPPLTLNILPGITRGVVGNLCENAGLPCEEADLTIDDLLDADEVFLTNSIMEIMPVCAVETKQVGDGQPGPITRQLGELYRETVAAECA